MSKQILLILFIVCCAFHAEAQKRTSSKHLIRPGISISYLPSWQLDDRDGNTYANLFSIGVLAHQEIWKESYLNAGLLYKKIDLSAGEEFIGIGIPISFSKFFNPERKGFNLGIGLSMGYCFECRERVNGALFQEINYLLTWSPVRVNLGLKTQLGAEFIESTFSVGGQLEFIWQPYAKKSKK